MRDPHIKKALDIGPAIMEHRMTKRMTQQDLGLKIGASRIYVDMVEKNQIIPSLTRFKSLSQVLNMDISPFLQWVEEKTFIIEEESPPVEEKSVNEKQEKVRLPEKTTEHSSLFSNLIKIFTPQERRSAPRFEADFMVLCQIQGEKVFKTTLDVSTVGLRILVSRVIPNHTIIQLEIETKSQVIHLKVRVIWTKEMKLPGLYQSGLDIIEISDQDRNTLQRVAEGTLKVEEI